MKHKILMAMAATTVILVSSLGLSFSQETERNKIIGGVQLEMADIYVNLSSSSLEPSGKIDENSLKKLNLDPADYPYSVYWDITYSSSSEGFVVEGRGIRPPVLGDVWSVDQKGRIMGD